MNLYAVTYVPIFSYSSADRSLATVHELSTLSGKLALPGLQTTDLLAPSFSILDSAGELFTSFSTEDKPFLDVYEPKHFIQSRFFIKASIEASFGEEWLRELPVEPPTMRSEVDAYQLAALLTGEDLNCFIQELTIVANLARPGTLNVSDAFLFVDGRQSRSTSTIINRLENSVKYVQQTGWPLLKDLQLEKVWTWVIKQNLANSFGFSPVARAYNALSHLFVESGKDDSLDLFWALMGVEALYAQGSTGIMEQISEKTRVLFGERLEHKKHLSRMYGLRSKFIHGDLPFPGRFYPWDASPEAEQYYEGLFQATYLAKAILIATLHILIERDWSGLQFDYTVTGQ